MADCDSWVEQDGASSPRAAAAGTSRDAARQDNAGRVTDSHLRTQVCAVCGISTNSYHLNYGVSSCLSCRAFFRRVVQQKMKTEMKCKGGSGGACVISPDNRKKCKRCRFDACVAAGMRADAVMSGDQYRVWFRRMLRKKKKEGGGKLKEQQQAAAGRSGAVATNYNSGGDSSTVCSNDESSENGDPAGSGRSSSPEDRDLDFFIGSMGVVSRDMGTSSPEVPTPDPCNLQMLQQSTSKGPAAAASGFSSADELRSDADFNLTRLGPGGIGASSFFPEAFEDDLDLPVLTVEDDYVRKKGQAATDKFLDRQESVLRQWETESAPADLKDRQYLRFVEGGRARWVQACSQARVPLTEFSHRLYKLHRSNESFTNTLLRSHLDTIASMFHFYSTLFPEFQRLPASDRRTLLERNTRLFTQYFLGRYFFAGSGFKQTQWLLLCQVPDFLNEESYLKFIPITTFNGMVHLFRDDEALRRYQEYARTLSTLVLGFECNCAMAVLCLFDVGPGMNLAEESAVKAVQDFTLEVAGFSSAKFNCAEPDTLRRILGLLRKMSADFDAGVAWEENMLYCGGGGDDSGGDNLVTQLLRLQQLSSRPPKTLDDLLAAQAESLDAYPFGEDLIQEYIMFNLGVPFSRTFLARLLLVAADRFRYVFRECSSSSRFGGPVPDERRVFLAVSLFAARLESAGNSREQLDAALGGFDREVVRRKFSVRLRAAVRTEKARLADFPFPPSVPESVVKEAAASMKKIQRFVANQNTYDLLSLALLFGVVGIADAKGDDNDDDEAPLSPATSRAIVDRLGVLSSSSSSPSLLSAFSEEALPALADISAAVAVIVKNAVE